MLIRFIVGNLYSFSEKTEFNMLTGDVRRHPHHVHKLGKVEVLRAAAVYGANGAGKSNLVKALDLLRDAATSERIPNDKISPFKLGTPADLPYPHLEIEVALGKKNYLYGLELAHNRVVEEWLYESGMGEKPDILIFERTTDEKGETKIKFAEKYESNSKAKLRKELYESEILKSQTTLLWQLSRAKESAIPESAQFSIWLDDQLSVLFADELPDGVLDKLLNDKEFHLFSNQFFPLLDTGIEEITVKTEKYKESDLRDDAQLLEDVLSDLENGDKVVSLGYDDGTPAAVMFEDNDLVVKKIASFHKDKTGAKFMFDFKDESDGTRKLTEFLTVFYAIKNSSETIVIDEIERSIHPSLIKTILQKLMAEKEVKGQLIFTTHESNLLDLDMFRQDEIWFAEKNEAGATTFYPLSDFPIRPDLDIEKGYLMGRFGAIPMLTDLKKLNWQALSHA
ncbi:MAG: ATP-binding protein [Saprospiraceae bacterium]|nr:ATP-binding protein [Saprospiraceae bacterium]